MHVVCRKASRPDGRSYKSIGVNLNGLSGRLQGSVEICLAVGAELAVEIQSNVENIALAKGSVAFRTVDEQDDVKQRRHESKHEHHANPCPWRISRKRVYEQECNQKSSC
jgi:hypothetical protein